MFAADNVDEDQLSPRSKEEQTGETKHWPFRTMSVMLKMLKLLRLSREGQ